MGTSKAELEWHGSTLLYRTAALLCRSVDGPVVVVVAPGQQLPGLPIGVMVVEDPVEGLGPMRGIATGLSAVADRAPAAFVCSTDMPFLHPAFVNRVLREFATADTDVVLPMARGFRQPLAAVYRTALADLIADLAAGGELRPGMLFEHCRLHRIDEEALLADPVLAVRRRSRIGDEPELAGGLRGCSSASPRRGHCPMLRGARICRSSRPAHGSGSDTRRRGSGRRHPTRPVRHGSIEWRSDDTRPAATARRRRHRGTVVGRRRRLSRRYDSDVAPGGYFGQALVVDIDGRTAAATPLQLEERVLRAYVGGVGLGTWLLHRLAPPLIDPLAPEAPLAFVFSPLVGTPLTTSAKFAVVAKSPLTGLITDALASSQFAISGKMTGNDAIVIRGRADVLSVLLIAHDGVRLVPAPELAGMAAAEAETSVRQTHGRGWRTAAIGPAGERGVRYATISHDGRHAGRGGLGAVLGAKNIKAVMVKAGARVAVADAPAVLAAAKDLRARSFGPATKKYRELGTLANLLAFNAVSTLPTRNFTAATFEGAPRLAAEELQSCARLLATVARPARSAASTFTLARTVAASGWSTRTCLPSGHSAVSPTPTTSSPPVLVATSSVSTRSLPAGRSRGRWNAWNEV